MVAPLTEEQLAEVQHLVGYDLWPQWLELSYPAKALEREYAATGNLRVVAAYVLRAICDHAQQEAAEVAARVRKIKVGPIELEKELGSVRSAERRADIACKRASALLSVAIASDGARSANPAPILEPWGLA